MKFLRLPQVQELTGLGRSTIYNRINEGLFPKQISLGGRCVAWNSSEVMAWMEQCVLVRGN
jgi:prophage regulatory protein